MERSALKTTTPSNNTHTQPNSFFFFLPSTYYTKNNNFSSYSAKASLLSPLSTRTHIHFHTSTQPHHPTSNTPTNTDQLLPPTPLPENTPELSLFTTFKATLACCEKTDTKKKRGRRKGERRESEATLVDTPLQSKQDSKSRTPRLSKASAHSGPLGNASHLYDELLQERETLRRQNEKILDRKTRTKHELREVEALLTELNAKRGSIEFKLKNLDDREESILNSLEELDIKIASAGKETFDLQRRLRNIKNEPVPQKTIHPGTCIKTLYGHEDVVTCLDFISPDGLLVTGSVDRTVRVWSLSSHRLLHTLTGHTGMVRCVQMSEQQALTGSNDGTVRHWDLSVLPPSNSPASLHGLDLNNEEARSSSFVTVSKPPSSSDQFLSSEASRATSIACCVSVLSGHDGGITCLHREGNVVVTGSSDQTMRQWDLSTGQPVLTLDVRWAMNSSSFASSSHVSTPSTLNSSFSPSIRPQRICSSPTRSLYSSAATVDGDEYGMGGVVGALQFWNYALACGTSDGAIGMWDLRTGLMHRTISGHLGPVTCLAFDDVHIVSGSMDKTIRVWDVRTGGMVDILNFDHPVSSMQFDDEKIVAAAGDSYIKKYHRTTFQSSSHKGHTQPVQCVRFREDLLVTGGRDRVVKLWTM